MPQTIIIWWEPHEIIFAICWITAAIILCTLWITDCKKITSTSETSSILDLQLEREGLANKQASDFNQFITPPNELFNWRCPYSALDANKNEIRLLRVFSLDPGGGSQALVPVSGGRTTPRIACQLLDKISLSRIEDNYCTISYRAGSAKDTEVILVDNCPFNAFSNLAHALHYVLQAWNAKTPGKPLLIWADQICVNQTDLKERAQQVSMMGEIYRRCDKTFVCISTPGRSNCLSWMKMGRPMQPSASTNDQALPLYKSPVALRQFKERIRNMFLIEPQTTHQSTIREQIRAWKPFLLSLEAFVNSTWWRRAWVYQEFITSTDPYLLSGIECLPWTEVEPIIQFVCSELVEFVHYLIDNAKIASQQQHQKYEEARQQHRQLMLLYKSRLESYDTIWRQRCEGPWQAKLALTQHEAACERQRQLEKENEAKRRADQLLSESEALRIARKDTKALKLRARSKLKHMALEKKPLSDKIRQQRAPTQRREIGINFETFIQLEKTSPNLQEFHALHGNKPVPPSNSELEQRKRDYDLTCYVMEGVDASISRLDRLDFSAISSLIECKRTERRDTDLMRHLQHSRKCESGDLRDRVYAFLGLAHCGYDITPNYTPENSVIHVMITTAQKTIKYEKTLDILKHVHCGRERLGHRLPTWVPDWSSRETKNSVLAFVADAESTLFAAGKPLPIVPEFEVDKSNESHVSMKVNGFLVASIDGSEELMSHFPKFRSFTTSSGYRVITPKSARRNDQVWVLNGASCPVLLRPETHRAYSFHGEVLVYEGESFSNIMFGSLLKDAATRFRNIWIM
jgi:Heterokaryon incompatibility protein (HET)